MAGPPLDSFNAVYFCCRRKCRRHLSTWRRSSRPFLSRFLGQMKYWVENTSSSFHFMHRNLLGYFFRPARTSCRAFDARPVHPQQFSSPSSPPPPSPPSPFPSSPPSACHPSCWRILPLANGHPKDPASSK